MRVLVVASFVFFFTNITGEVSAQNMALDTANANAYVQIAEQFHDSAKYDSAVFYYQKASNEYRLNKAWSRYVLSLNGIAENLNYQAKSEEALIYLDTALNVANIHLHNTDIGLANVYSNFAYCYESLGNEVKAFLYQQKTLKIRIKLLGKEHPDVGKSHHLLADCYYDMQDFEQTITHCNLALAIQLNALTENHSDVAAIYATKGLASRLLADYEQAEFCLQKAVDIFTSLYGEKHEDVANATEELGIVFRDQGDFHKGLDFARKALKIKIAVLGELHHDVAMAYNTVGWYYFDLGHFEKQIFNKQKALDILLQLYPEDHPDIALVYTNIGSYYQQKGEFEKQMLYQRKAMNIRLRLFGEEHPVVGDSYMFMSFSFGNNNEYDKALEYSQKTLDIWKKVYGEVHPMVAYCYDYRSHYYMQNQQYTEAISSLQKALDIRIATLGENHPYVANSYYNMGNTLAIQGNFVTSLEYLQKGLASLQEAYGPNNLEVIQCHVEKGIIFSKLNLRDSALTNFQRALLAIAPGFENTSIYSNPQLAGIEHKSLLLKILRWKAGVLEKNSRQNSNEEHMLTTAMQTFQLAASLVDTMRFELTTSRAKSELAARTIPIYEGAIRSSLKLFNSTRDSHLLAQTLDFAEKNKSFQLREALNESDAKHYGGIPDSLVKLDQVLKTEIAFYQKQLFNSEQKDDSSKTALYQNYLFDNQIKYDELIATLETNYPKYYQLKYNLKIATAKSIQSELLTSEQAMLEYFVGDSSVFTFVVTKEDFQVFESKFDSVYSSHITSLRLALTDKTSQPNSFAASAYYLFQKLIKPAEGLIAGKTLTIIPDGMLSYIPFETLIVDFPHNQKINYVELPYLCKEYQINYCYSATLLAQLQDTKLSPKNVRFIAYAPDFNNSEKRDTTATELFADNDRVRGSLVSLSGTVKEVEALSRYMKGTQYFNEEATEKSFKENAGNYNIIHLATHAIIDDKHPKNSRLIFTSGGDSIEDGDFHAHEIYGLDLNADMVMLSACNTGFGKLERGEGVASLARAFYYAGCPSVIMSLWPAHDRVTAEISENFYDALSKGKSKDHALRHAKLQYLQDADNKTAHPFYWAGFVATGDMQSMNIQGDKPSWLLLLIIIPIFLGGYLVAKRKSSKVA